MDKRSTVRAVCLLFVALAVLAAAEAQQGNQVKIVGVVLSVRHRVGPSGAMTPSKVGVLLPAGSRVETGPRSKCALKFPDGGVVVLDQQSALIIQSGTGTSVQLSGGRLWAKVIAGTSARVQGASGVAVVKGTEWTFDGRSIVCYDGDVTYETKTATLDVPAGFEGTAEPDGTVSMRAAPGRSYPGGDLIQWFGGALGASVAVTPGSTAGIERKEIETPLERTLTVAANPPATKGSAQVIVESVRERVRSLRAPGGARSGSAASWGNFPGVDPNTLAPVMGAWGGLGGSLSVPTGLAGQTQPLGKKYLFGPYTPCDAFAYMDDQGGSAFGLRVRPHLVAGPVYIEVGATLHGTTFYRDGIDITEAFATYRPQWGELTVGRQRFLEGPVNNSRLGSVLSFDTGDAVRAKTRWGKLSLDAAYVRRQSPIIGPSPQGWYGRAQYPLGNGLIAANVVTESGKGAGWSVDTAVPAIKGTLDAYAEFGKNASDQTVYTVGLYFPSLYQRQHMDLFVEYAHREGLPGQATARLYRHFGDKLTAVFAVDKPSGASFNLGAGVIWRFGD